MARTSTNISLDPELKRSSQELFADLGIDLSTAITLFLKQSLRVQGLPFAVTRENPNAETAAALNEYVEMKAHPEKYKRYASFQDVVHSNRFKKDLKLAAKRGLDLDALNAIVDQLAAGQPLPDKNRDHALTGDYIGFRECHIRPDWLLVYRVDGEDLILFLFRTGSHTDLFD